MADASSPPDFDDLPLNPGDPPHSAWGLYDIQKVPSFGRQPFHKDVIHKTPRIVNDDVWTLNTQSSTQCKLRCNRGPSKWKLNNVFTGDGLRHFAYQKEQMFYNGVTLDDIHSGSDAVVNGIHEWAKRGIVGRGILLDFHSWRLAHNVAYNPFESGPITLEQLQAVLRAQGTKARFGDILFIRSGRPTASQKDWALHEVLLSGWGMPIGELFDLDELATECKRLKRWSFFLTSEVCNVPGGVARSVNLGTSSLIY
ncbi:MAG: hypothetical protein L6R37_001020 [Teloschistes peruensis]|nr:MAG: hypothetical protein L6R37_001020 [Teloschistes peruensis]